MGTAHPFRGGIAAFNERLAKEFIKEGNQVIIYTFKLQYPGILFPGKTQFANWEAPVDLDIRIKLNSINPFNWIKVGRMIKKENADHVIIPYWLPFMAPCLGTIARIIKQNKHSRIFSLIHNIIPHEKRIGDRLLSRYFVKPIEGFVAMSHAVLQDLNTFDSDKPKAFSPHPIYDNYGEIKSKAAARADLLLDSEFNYLLFFGFIRAYKGLDLVIEAMADKRIRNMPLKLIVAGEFYENSEKYLELIAGLKLADKVILKTDFIPDAEVSNFFCAADLIVQPYKSATQSGVTQIGFHFEKPMLVTDVGGLKEIIPHKKAGYVTQPEKKEIADAIVDFYANNREQAFLEAVRNEKKKYLWNKMTNSFYHLFKP